MSGQSADYRGLKPTSAHASAVGRGNRRSETRPEILLRQALWRRGLRYRLDTAALPGKPDLIFPRQRVAVFCDGDFWHGSEWPTRREKLARGANAEYWLAKISGNMARDRSVTEELCSLGWRVVRVWESEVHSGPEAVATRIETELKGR